MVTGRRRTGFRGLSRAATAPSSTGSGAVAVPATRSGEAGRPPFAARQARAPAERSGAPAPAPAPALYAATVRHVRRDPIHHEFAHTTYYWSIDLDEPPVLPLPLRPLAGFRAEDHGGARGEPLRADIDRFLAAHGIDLDGGRIRMLAHARVLGHVFNPLTVYWCRYAGGAPACVVAEVSNTHGERHRYLLDPDEHGRARTAKEFYVSPFNEVDGQYMLVLPEPDERLSISAVLHREGRKPFAATVRGTRVDASATALLRLTAKRPLAPLIGVVQIRYQGIRLYLRGLSLVPKPDPPHIERQNRMTTETGTAVDTGTAARTTADEQWIDGDRWPDVARTPSARVRGPVARAIGDRAFLRLPIRVAGPDGELPAGGGPGAPLLRLRDPDAFFRRLGSSGLIGFGESYMAGEWDSPDLVALLQACAAAYDDIVPTALQPFRHITLPRRPVSERNTATGARRNISHHYDLSNELFALFLDATMTYSAGLFDGAPADGPDDLAEAQHRKIDRLLDGASVGEGTRLLEIGTGWGELAIRAARRGAAVRSITLSAEQRDLAIERAEEAGVADAVTVELCDYRDVRGAYDAVVSVEMVEAVGERYWPVFFTALDRLTAPGGKVALQAITMDHDLMRASRNGFTWMHKYIFPGGLVPSVTAMRREIETRTALRLTDRNAFGHDYARTLHIWRESFAKSDDQIARLGFDPVFRRMWDFYLAYCEAGFRADMIDVEQLFLERSR